MKHKGLHLAISSILCFLSLTGTCSDSTATLLKRNVIFASFGGKENRGSINFEHIFSTGKKFHWSYSVGIQSFQLSEKFSLPVSVNFFTRGRLHHAELDLTATFYMDKFHPYNGGRQDDFNKQVYLTPFLCYRLQGSRGFMVKAGVGPQVLFDPPSNDVLSFRTKLLSPSVFGSIGFCF